MGTAYGMLSRHPAAPITVSKCWQSFSLCVVCFFSNYYRQANVLEASVRKQYLSGAG